MEITYIGHSGFLVELEHTALLFDYWQGDFTLPAGKRLYVFASHRHPDHFNPEIFNLKAGHPEVQFILSDDIWQSRVPERTAARVRTASGRALNGATAASPCRPSNRRTRAWPFVCSARGNASITQGI